MQLDLKTVITRALAVGAVVGVILAVYLWAIVEPVIDEAIELEEQLAAQSEDGDAGHSHDDDEALFSRDEQVGGGMVASVIYSVIFAGVFGTVLAATRHRLPGATDLGRSMWLASVAFGTIALMPAIKYPATPPAVGDGDTVNERTVQWLVLVAVSVALAWALTKLAGRLRGSMDDATRYLAVGAITVVSYAIVLAVLPTTPDEIDPAVPAALVWDFRVRSLGGLALMWGGVGAGLGVVLTRMSGASTASNAEMANA